MTGLGESWSTEVPREVEDQLRCKSSQAGVQVVGSGLIKGNATLGLCGDLHEKRAEMEIQKCNFIWLVSGH